MFLAILLLSAVWVRGFEDEFLASRYLTTTRVSGYHFRRNVFPQIEFIIKTKKD